MTDKEASVYYEMTKAVAEKFLRLLYGPRCDVFQEECDCCERWKALDILVENPFKTPRKKKNEPRRGSKGKQSTGATKGVRSRRASAK